MIMFTTYFKCYKVYCLEKCFLKRATDTVNGKAVQVSLVCYYIIIKQYILLYNNNNDDVYYYYYTVMNWKYLAMKFLKTLQKTWILFDFPCL